MQLDFKSNFIDWVLKIFLVILDKDKHDGTEKNREAAIVYSFSHY